MMKKLTFILLFFITINLTAGPQPGDFFTRGPKEPKRIAVSFDDGPGPATPKFLELLDRYKVKATFFMLGQQIKYRPKIAQRVFEKGHELASHTWQHTNYKKRLSEIEREFGPNAKGSKGAIDLAKSELVADMEKTNDRIKRITGKPVKLLRMPHGIDRPWINESAKKAGVVLVNWTHGADWSSEPFEDLKEGYIDAIKPGAILLFHDGGGNRDKSLRLTEAVLQVAKLKGYEIVTIGKLIDIQ